MKRTTILVTGGAGFVGSHFARAAVDVGREVVVLDDLSGGVAPR
jgi:UDP-glucose 4-epimerase